MAKKTDSVKKPAAQAAPAKPAAKTTAKISAPAPAPVKVPAAASKAAPVKKAVKKAAAKTVKVAPAPSAPVAKGITTEEIALQAYFISEKRHAAGLPGNAHQDWLEAERQLKAKAQKAQARARKSA